MKLFRHFRLLIAGLAVLSVLASGVATGQDSRDIAPLGQHTEGEFAPAPASVRSQPQRRLPQSSLPAQVILDPVSSQKMQMEATAQPSKPGVPLKIGFSRDVPTLRTSPQTSALMVWSSVSGGQVAAISITSPDALGVRLGLLVENLPTTALLRFYAQGADQVFEVSGQEIMETIARNLAAGDKSDEARTYWSPVINGQEITVEIELPAGVYPDEVMFSIPRVSHLFSSPLDTRALQEKYGNGSASCNLDSTCYTSTWGNESLTTAKMTFTSGGSSYLCTGTLMNDKDSSTSIPFFLTANHCISTQTEASTLQTYWFYRASSCNSGSLSSSTQTLTNGATLLYNSSTTDTSFLRLNSNPPSGVYYSGWSANLQTLYTPATGIHNPGGDLQKINFGTITDYSSCTLPDSLGNFNCTSASSGSADHLSVVWSQGITEGGSSGSGLWVTSGSSHYLVGQLHGGSSSCSTPTSADRYGRFDVAYSAALYQWLGTTSSCSYALDSTSQSVTSAATTGTVNVITGSSCSWTAASNSSWITVTSGASGSGNGTVTYSVTANTGTSARTGTLTIGGQTFTVTQAGVVCTNSISPSSQSASATGLSGTISVSSTSGCAWTATSNVRWITITSGSSGSGNGTVVYSVAANTRTRARTGSLTIAGQTFTVTQRRKSVR